MMAAEHIHTVKKEHGRLAKKAKMQPFIALENSDEGVRQMPFLGDYVPAGWKVGNTYFVDNSGYGMSGEAALTFNEFLAKVKSGCGYGIYESGQFQVYVREYWKK